MGLCGINAFCIRAVAGMVDDMATRTLTPAVAALAGDISAIVRQDQPAIDTARLVADAVGRKLGTPGILTDEQQEHDDACYRQHVLYVDPEGLFSIVSLVWMPGQETVIHDHVTWCVVGVHQGNEEETLYRLVDNGLEPEHLVQSGHSLNGEGTTSYFVPPGDIHKVCNSSDRKVISIHVYGTDIAARGNSVRRRYDLPIKTR
jgi:predicted metal-dependent enzyme (double-stranded beta helix superfamily)